MRYKIVSIIILIIAGLTSGCGSKLDSGGLTPLSLVQFQSTPDTTAPTVSAWSPQGSGIGLTTVISVRFSERMAAATINTSTFTVVSGGVAVSGTVAYSSSTGTYVFTPASSLAYITTYTVTIASAVTDRAGNTMASAFSWSFTTVDKGTLPAPTITPIGGTFDSSQTVSIQYSGPAATIYYTTDGSAPSTSSSSFTGTSLDINVAINTTIRAFASGNASYYDSAEATDVYNIRTTQPVFTHDTGSYPNDMTLTSTELYHPDGGTIYYTMTTGTTAAPPADPADPDTGSTVFNASDTIAIAGDLTVVKIKAAALLTNMTMSQPVMRTYTIDYVQIGAPSFSLDPATGPFDGTQTVQMTHTATPQPQIYYTLDGSDPTDVLNTGRLSYTYGTDISIFDTTTINAYAEGAANSMKDSNVEVGHFVINPVIGKITPNSGQIGASVTVTITGSLFKIGAGVALQMSGEPDVSPSVMSVIDSNTISCQFDLIGVTNGKWNVVVFNTDGGIATLASGFRSYNASPTGTVSWWKFDGDATDSVGTNHGTVGSSITYDADRFGAAGMAANGDGSTLATVTATTTGFPVGAAARTMMGWFYISTVHTGDNFLFGYGAAERFNLYVNYLTNRLAFSNGSSEVKGNTVLATGRWYHAAVTYDGTTAVLYLDGMIEGSAAMTLATDAGSTMNMLKLATIQYLNGRLDDVMVVNSALSQAEIQEIAASGGYLLPPTNLDPSKGTISDHVALTWDPVLDATGYDVWRSGSLIAAPVKLTTVPVTATSYDDYSATANTIYYYRVQAVNPAGSSALTKAEIGYSGSATEFTEDFETGSCSSWWDGGVAVVGDTSYTVDTIGNYSGSYGMYVHPSASCSSGCGLNQTVRLMKDFSLSSPITHFTLSMWYNRQTMNGGEIRVYVNNMNPTDDTGLVLFKEEQVTGGWKQLHASYMGEVGGISSITVMFYDITTNNWYYADDIVIKYK